MYFAWLIPSVKDGGTIFWSISSINVVCPDISTAQTREKMKRRERERRLAKRFFEHFLVNKWSHLGCLIDLA